MSGSTKRDEDQILCGGCPEPLTNQCGSCTKFFCSCPPRSTIQYSIWANEQAFWSGWCILVGAILTAPLELRPVMPTGLGLYTRYVSIFIGILVIFVEYPRGKKLRGSTSMERPYQMYIAPIIYFFRFLTRNYFIRGFVYFILSIPNFFILSTHFGGITLFLASIFYLVSAMFNEKWIPPSLAYGPDSSMDKMQSANENKSTYSLAPPTDEVPQLPSEISVSSSEYK